MPERDLPHIFIQGWADSEPYTPYGGGGGEELPERDRTQHGRFLRRALDETTRQAHEARRHADVDVDIRASGVYLTFESVPGIELALESLENRRLRRPAELVAVRTIEGDDGPIQLATVYIPDEAIATFVRKVEQYLTEETQKGLPRHQNSLERIAGIRLATLEALWTESTTPFPPSDRRFWWEVWLRRDGGDEVDRFLHYAEAVDARVGPRRLAFADRTVMLVHATAEQLAQSVAVLDDLAELREARTPSEFFARMPPAEQAEWIRDLLQRLTFADDPDAPAVCVLDTGVRGEHPLLRSALNRDDIHAVDPSWGTADHHGHGTEMCGIALYGAELAALLASSEPIRLNHILESVKILPPPPAHNDPELYGAITAEAMSRVEIQAPSRRRAFTMAVSSTIPGPETGHAFGQPTSWSSAIDATCVGRSFVPLEDGLAYLDFDEEPHSRLAIVAAGNVRPPAWAEEHLDRSDVEPIEDPGHAWNALTVGAFTELTDPSPLEGHRALAPAGELSPHSRTSVAFASQWPAKPDVLFEGGNVAMSPGGEFDTPESMQLLTSWGRDGSRLLTVSGATSAAAAQAARMAAQVWDAYPRLWPETIRALIVHGSRWTAPMQTRIETAPSRTATDALLRRYGMGVPRLDLVLRSAANELVLVAEDTIHPFEEGRLREMHLYELPWPLEELEALGEANVQLRVTLSYFVEPNPSRRGWVGRFRYASHGLRFDVKLPVESVSDFRKRLNKNALAEDERKPTGLSDATEWVLGRVVRHRGSIHTDVWSGTAADLAARGMLAVYPVSGWWKELKARDRSDIGVRYSLVVSIEAPAVDVDFWTPVSAKVGIPVEAQIIT